MKNAVTRYRALDLENEIAGGSHVSGFLVQAIPILTTHDRERLTVMDKKNNEEKKKFD